jgi:hypothetical protein
LDEIDRVAGSIIGAAIEVHHFDSSGTTSPFPRGLCLSGWIADQLRSWTVMMCFGDVALGDHLDPVVLALLSVLSVISVVNCIFIQWRFIAPWGVQE